MASPSAAAASWPWPATSASRARRPRPTARHGPALKVRRKATCGRVSLRVSTYPQGGPTMAVDVTREGAVAVVTVDRPEALNALNSATNQLLLAAVGELSADDSVRAVVFTGGGDKSFVAGADIAEMKAFTAEEARRFGALGQAVMSGIEAAPQPWIAAVN